MADRSDFETADRLARRRARIWPVLAIFFIAQQTAYFSHAGAGDRTVDHFRVSAWIACSIVLLIALLTGGGWLRRKQVRALLNDEGTRANRALALETGFIAAMTAAIGLYFFSLFEPLGGREAVHLLLSVGIGFAILRFAMLERRGLRGG